MKAIHEKIIKELEFLMHQNQETDSVILVISTKDGLISESIINRTGIKIPKMEILHILLQHNLDIWQQHEDQQNKTNLN